MAAFNESAIVFHGCSTVGRSDERERTAISVSVGPNKSLIGPWNKKMFHGTFGLSAAGLFWIGYAAWIVLIVAEVVL